MIAAATRIRCPACSAEVSADIVDAIAALLDSRRDRDAVVDCSSCGQSVLVDRLIEQRDARLRFVSIELEIEIEEGD